MMDNLEAYELLSQRLHFYSRNTAILDTHPSNGEIEETVTSQSGRTYVMSFRRAKNKILGRIHDGNTANFRLLEESITIE